MTIARDIDEHVWVLQAYLITAALSPTSALEDCVLLTHALLYSQSDAQHRRRRSLHCSWISTLE